MSYPFLISFHVFAECHPWLGYTSDWICVCQNLMKMYIKYVLICVIANIPKKQSHDIIIHFKTECLFPIVVFTLPTSWIWFLCTFTCSTKEDLSDQLSHTWSTSLFHCKQLNISVSGNSQVRQKWTLTPPVDLTWDHWDEWAQSKTQFAEMLLRLLHFL